MYHFCCMLHYVRIVGVVVLGALLVPVVADAQVDQRAFLNTYCVGCHNERTVNGRGTAPSPLVSQLRAIGLSLDVLDPESVEDAPASWEKVVRKLRGGMMPPAGRRRPGPAEQEAFVTWLESALDQASLDRANPGRPATLHRLNRVEYRNAIRDLLALGVRVEQLLPADDSSYGFDNMGTALRMPQALLERYLAAAKTVSRLAVGSPPPSVSGETYRLATRNSRPLAPCFEAHFGSTVAGAVRGGMRPVGTA